MISAPTRIHATDDELLHELERFCGRGLPQDPPSRIFFPEILQRVLEATGAYRSRLPLLRFGYSVKTNPARAVLGAAKSAGLLAEVISPQEFAHAIACGFSATDVIYNGPYPAARCAQPPAYVFADSVEAFTGASRAFPQATIGVRLRPPAVASHFGVPRERLGDLARALHSCGRREIGISFHVRPEDYGSYDFRRLTQVVVTCAQDLERLSGARVAVFDAGGGHGPQEFDDAICEGDLQWLEQHVTGALPHVNAILIEPGQALVTACEAVLALVLEVRRYDDDVCEVVLNAGYPELPQINSFRHRMFWIDGDAVRPVAPGAGRILGRTCLEYDVLATDVELGTCRAGDVIAIADAGAYDASMGFDFARGRRCQ